MKNVNQSSPSLLALEERGLLKAPWDSHPISQLPVFDWALPGGTSLRSFEHSHLATTIWQILYSLSKREENSDSVNSGIDSLSRAYGTLVHWMLRNRIFYFQLLSKEDLKAFLKDYSKGFDVVIDGTPRLVGFLNSLRAEELPKLTFLSALERAGLPPGLRKIRKVTRAFKEFKKQGRVLDINPEAQRVTRGHLDLALRAITNLHSDDGTLADGLTYIPNADGALHALCVKLGLPGGSTETLPDQLSVEILRKSIHWVVNLGPLIIDVERQLVAVKGYQAQKKMLPHLVEKLTERCRAEGWNMVFTSDRRPGLRQTRFSIALTNHLRAACFIVIAVLSGRRSMEVVGLRGDSLIGSDAHGYWLDGPIGKRAMEDRTPCPKLVALTVNTMLQLHRVGNEALPAKLFSLTRTHTKTGEPYELPFRSNLIQQFAALEGLVEYEIDGRKASWMYAPHQFRRLFALIYFWRYDDPALVALAYHFRHMNMKMIRAYVRDAAFRQMMANEGKRFTASKLRSMVHGAVEGFGILGRSLKRAIERMRQSVDVVDSAALIRRVHVYIELRGLTLNPTPWGFCGASSERSNLRRAACQQEGMWKRIDLFTGTPDASASSEETCAKCLFHMTDDSRQTHWEAGIIRLTAAIEAGDKSSLMTEALIARRGVLQTFVRNAFLKGAI